MSFIGGMIGGVVGGMLASPKNGASNQPQLVLREGAELLYYNTQLDAAQRVFGVAGASLYHANLQNASAVKAGIEGEERVAYELEALAASYPNTYVFHSMKMHGSIGDMDHIVVQGRRALLVDSKNWRRKASYDLAQIWDDGDIVFRDGEMFSGSEIHLRRQMIDWQLLFVNSDVAVEAVLVVANKESTTVQSIDTGYSFVNLTGLAATFANTFTQNHTEPLSTEMLHFYGNMVQDPHFDPNDMSNYVQVGNYAPANYYAAPAKSSATRMTKWLVFWSIMNYVLMPFMFPIAGISAIPLIFLAHRHKKYVIQNGKGGSGLLTAVLVFSYLMLAVWALGSALVAAYYLILPSFIGV